MTDELYHYGVKGQKWRVRRYQNRDGTRTSLGKKREREKKQGQNTYNRKKLLSKISKNISKKTKTKSSSKKKQATESQAQKEALIKRKNEIKNRRNMSDSELTKKIDRLKLEKQYKDLATSDVSAGRQYVTNILKTAGTQTLTSAASGAMAYTIRAAMTGKFNLKEAADYVIPPKGKK